MRLLIFVALVFISGSTAESKGLFGAYKNSSNSLGQCSYEATCSAGGEEGVCVSISAGCCSGAVTSGLCPGSSDIKCCTVPSCTTPSGTGVCKSTSSCLSSGGSSYAGYCVGPSDLQCCISSDSCSTPVGSGQCMSTSSCSSSGGNSYSGFCPGPADIQCCIKGVCSTPAGTGQCMETSACASSGGSSYAGYCPGAADVQCCVKAPPSSSTRGFDISTTLSSSAASCLANSGYSFTIPRGYMSTGAVDTRVCSSIIAAHNAGVKIKDTYLFPCPTCSKSAATQISELLSHLRSNCNNEWSGRIWLDIEGSQYWLGSASANQAWFKTLKDACSNSGARCGIYSGASQWSAIFGSLSFVYGNELPLWYAHYDNNPSFSDFSPFAGWSSPHAKQYVGDATLCGMGVDLNYSPSF